MRGDCPEFGDARLRDTPARACSGKMFERRTRQAMLRGRSPVRVEEKIRVDRDHSGREIQRYIDSRSATSIPGGKPPRTVTHRMRRRRRRPVRGRWSSLRRPRSMSVRSVHRNSAARFFAATKRSSGSSIVVFIRVTILP